MLLPDLDARKGFYIETSTNAITGNFAWLFVISAATFTKLTLPGNEGSVGTGFAWPAGSWIPAVTEFTMSGGRVIAFNAAKS